MKNDAISMFKQSVVFNDNMIWIKPVCDFFNIDYKYQVEVVRKDPILTTMVEKNSSQLLFGDNRDRILLPKKGFIRWIQILNPNIVSPELKFKLIEYQTFVFDFLYGNFEQEQQAKIDYARLKKLKILYGKIGREIQRIEKGFNVFLDNKYQYKLDFNQQLSANG